MLQLPDNFRFLNRENQWLDFNRAGLELTAEGALRLFPSPRLIGTPPELGRMQAPEAPAGVAADASGGLFYSVPEQNKVFSTGGCAPELTELRCLTESAALTPLKEPRGLLLLDNPSRLVVVDSGNHRLLFFDLASFAIRDLWGQDDLAAEPVPGQVPGKFNTPWTVSRDGDGNLYVLDYGNSRVQKFLPTGEPLDEFAQRLKQAAPHPGALAVWGKGSSVTVFVFDTAAGAILGFDGSGAQVRDSSGNPLVIRYPDMTNVLALAATAEVLYAGDNHLRRVLTFRRSAQFAFSGEVAEFDGPVAALTVDPAGAIAISTGGPAQPLRASAEGAYLRFGVLWSSAIAGGPLPVIWNRLHTVIENAPGAHIEFYYSISNSTAPPPVDEKSASPFSNSRWVELPNDVEDFLFGDSPPDANKGRFLFVGAIFRGDGFASARLKQMRADFDHAGYLPYLPAIYREPEDAARYVRRFVSLFEGIFDDVEEEVEALPRYFDPRVVPAEALPWLASWLAVELDQGEPVARIRASIASAYRRYQWRGTAEGLKLALLQDAGVHANIVQPIANASYWAFPADTHCSGTPSTPTQPQLGATTNLPSMQPGGAVLGSTAQLDHSYLITDAEFGEPLFDGSANQFVVEVYASEVSSKSRLALVKEIVEREKPAHTMWRLSVLEASMRVGAQARSGIDSIVAGTPGPAGLGLGHTSRLRLGGSPAPRVGASRLGQDLKLER
jgi:phage tail-like protein